MIEEPNPRPTWDGARGTGTSGTSGVVRGPLGPAGVVGTTAGGAHVGSTPVAAGRPTRAATGPRRAPAGTRQEQAGVRQEQAGVRRNDGLCRNEGPHRDDGSHRDDGPTGDGPRRDDGPRGVGRVGWRRAAETALYGPGGFYLRPEGPAGHFRTSVHVSPLFAEAVARLLCRVDEALGRPAELAFVDMGAGRGELVTAVLGALPADVAARTRGYAVERAQPPRPARLTEADGAGAGAGALSGAAPGTGTTTEAGTGTDAVATPIWCREPPQGVTGLLFANEWLDNVPVDVVETDADGVPRQVLVDRDGTEALGEPVGAGRDGRWLARWWPLAPRPGLRAEIGWPRDAAWARAVRSLDAGLAVAVDYLHLRASRPPHGTLTGFRAGREVAPVPDGSCDITAHVALDACAAAGAEAVAPRARPGTGAGAVSDAEDAVGPDTEDEVGAGAEDGTGPDAGGGAVAGASGGVETGARTGAHGPRLVTQRAALHALGLFGARPPLSLAGTDPAGYVRALAAAGEAAELTARDGLGAFGWLLQPVRLRYPAGLPDTPPPS